MLKNNNKAQTLQIMEVLRTKGLLPLNKPTWTNISSLATRMIILHSLVFQALIHNLQLQKFQLLQESLKLSSKDWMCLPYKRR
jgi:hypothetical protein